ncbi:uncharacterized protein MELLADRAFT_107631 [Melampsora larici-populina 98AG31]|uniref:Uncharacterized protein n=1 Tax=Melampsora larici-populina (strain 98AG31 / pathotype 3-4-7) TaxID=747676 RepID=F4RQ96_MELLP|nr:uncharacterized protein MELLADRAFT_107631 [Melampsora larici-populina 98AG31]EGG05366.1 hypothetical protein MELLADRAFT_107631 [Melampsora larici-populina 98AG31]
MIKTEVLKLLSIYNLLLFSKFHSSISPSLTGVIDFAHESATGITDSHDAGAVKSTIELTSERIPHSQPQPCRRNLGGCFGGLFRGSGTTARTSQAGIRGGETAEGSRATDTIARTKSWTFKISSNFRRVQSKLLFSFFPKTRENWNLVHASYEEILASAIRSRSGWGDEGSLAASLADLRTARRLSTEGLGFNPYVRQYISKTEIPKLHQDLVKSLDTVFESLLRDQGGRPDNMPSKVAIINNLFKAELQDPELAPLLEPFQSRLNRLNAGHPTESTDLPRTLSSAELPLKPSFSNLKQLKAEPTQAQAIDRFWKKMSFQFDAERNHVEYLRKIHRPRLTEWRNLRDLTRDFESTTSSSEWSARTFHPEKFTIPNYQKLRRIGTARRALIKEAARGSKARYYAEKGLTADEILIRRKLELETLLIESLGEHHDEATEMVQDLITRARSTTAQPYLHYIYNYNSPAMRFETNPSFTLNWQRFTQQLPFTRGRGETRSGTPATAPTTPPRELDYSRFSGPIDIEDGQNVAFPDASFVGGSAVFDYVDPSAQREFVQNALLNRLHGN